MHGESGSFPWLQIRSPELLSDHMNAADVESIVVPLCRYLVRSPYFVRQLPATAEEKVLMSETDSSSDNTR